MRFWDASAVVPLVVPEAKTFAARAALEQDNVVLVWWATQVECTSAVSRLERRGELPPDEAEQALQRLQAVAGSWHEVQPTEPLRRTARRLLRVHDLRSANAFQLAAATVACEGDPATLPFVCLDERLGDAARREGFPLLDLGQ